MRERRREKEGGRKGQSRGGRQREGRVRGRGGRQRAGRGSEREGKGERWKIVRDTYEAEECVKYTV